MTAKRIVLISFLLAFCIIGYFAAVHLIKQKTIDKIDRTVSEIHYVEQLDFAGLHIGFSAPRLTMKEISLKIRGLEGKIRVKKFMVHDYEEKNNVVGNLNFEATGIQLPLENLQLSGKADKKRKAAIDDPLFNLKCRYTYDPVSKVFHLKTFHTESESIGELIFSATLSNMNLNSISLNSPATLIASLTGVYLNSATLIYDDHSFLNELLKTGKKTANSTITNITANAICRISRIAGQESDPFVKGSLLAARNFLRNPERIEVRAAPENPVLLGRLLFIRKPEGLIRTLRLRIME